jgi:hypothetical protein
MQIKVLVGSKFWTLEILLLPFIDTSAVALANARASSLVG